MAKKSIVILCAIIFTACDGFNVKQLSATSRHSFVKQQLFAYQNQNEALIDGVNSRSCQVDEGRRETRLSAISIKSSLETNVEKKQPLDFAASSTWFPILSSSLLITGNTVGACMLVLPGLTEGPGLGASSVVFLVCYLMNLLSGLVIAEVSINQHESSGSDVPSSFKEFAEVNLESSVAANVISGLSIFVNTCVLAFSFLTIGEMGTSLLGNQVDPTLVSFGFFGILGALLASQNGEKLSNVASIFVFGLFASFAGLLLPGLSSITDPMTAVFSSGTTPDSFGAATQILPVVLISMVYQNIVPSVTKILNYDRVKTTMSVLLGSFIPLVMYLAWCLAVVGGGIDGSLGMAGPLMTVFSLATLSGSCLGAGISVAEEFDSFLKPAELQSNDKFSMPATVATLGIASFSALTFVGGEDASALLGVAGSIGTPLLYGIIPGLMLWNQRQKLNTLKASIVPGGVASLGALVLSSTGLVGQEISHYASEMLAIGV